MTVKSRKVSCPTSSLFKTKFHKIGLCLFEWAYFLRSKSNISFTESLL